MAISANPMEAEATKLKDELAAKTRAGYLEAMRARIRAHGTAEQIKTMETKDRAADRLERMVEKRMERTTDQRINAAVLADEIKHQPKSGPRPAYEAGNTPSAVGMTPLQKERSEDRAAHNVEAQNIQSSEATAALTYELRCRKLEPIAQAVEREQRNREGTERASQRGSARGQGRGAGRDKDQGLAD